MVMTNVAQAQSLSQPRIVTLAPHLAQLAHAAGVGRHVVGVSEYTHKDYSQIQGQVQAQTQGQPLPQVGNAFAVNWQMIAQLKPTLVLVWGSGTPTSVKAKLKALGLATFESEPKTLSGIVQEAQQLAKLLSEPSDNAELLRLQRQFASLSALRADVVKRKAGESIAVFHPFGPSP